MAKSKTLSTSLAIALFSTGLWASGPVGGITVTEVPSTSYFAPELALPEAPGMHGEYVIPNAPMLRPNNILTIRAIGMGVAPPHASSRAQQMALAKRAAIVDGYRQMGEKMHGIQINARETVRDAMLVRSEVRTQLYSIVRGAEVVETIWDSETGLCQVEMEVKLDGRRWYNVLAGPQRAAPAMSHPSGCVPGSVHNVNINMDAQCAPLHGIFLPPTPVAQLEQ